MTDCRQEIVFLILLKVYTMLKKIILFLLAAMILQAGSAQTLEMDQSRDIAGSRSEKINPERFSGKVLVLVFWNTTDERCHAEIPEIIEMSNWYKNAKDVVFLAPTSDPPSKIEEYLHGQRGNLRIIPRARELIRQYNVTSFPTYIVFDKDGEQRFDGRSLPASSEIKDRLFEKIAELKSR